jgi:hypothetical protein
MYRLLRCTGSCAAGSPESDASLAEDAPVCQRALAVFCGGTGFSLAAGNECVDDAEG